MWSSRVFKGAGWWAAGIVIASLTAPNLAAQIPGEANRIQLELRIAALQTLACAPPVVPPDPDVPRWKADLDNNAGNAIAVFAAQIAWLKANSLPGVSQDDQDGMVDSRNAKVAALANVCAAATIAKFSHAPAPVVAAAVLPVVAALPIAAAAAPACLSKVYNGSLGKPTIDAVTPGSGPVNGKLSIAANGTVAICNNGKVLTAPVAVVAASNSFSQRLPAPINLTAGDKLQAQFIDTGGVAGPPSDELIVGSCSSVPRDGSAAPKLTVTIDDDGNVKYAGTTTAGGSVRICVDDLQNLASVMAGADGTFSGALPGVKANSVVAAQVVQLGAAGTKYGGLGDQVGVAACSAVGSKSDDARPKLNTPHAGSVFVGGSIPGAKAGTSIRVCVDDLQSSLTEVDHNQDFTRKLPESLKVDQSVAAQEITSKPGELPRTYGLVGPAQKAKGFAYSSLYGTFIAGVEQSGYSSEVTNTNFFVSAYIRSGYLPFRDASFKPSAPGLALWGRTRLLSAPQPSTQNIVSVLTDPAGQISQTSFSKVGQVVDYVLGPELRMWQWDRQNGQTDRISFFAGLGATTPLQSDSATLTYNAPLPNTPECAALVARYQPDPKRGVVGLFPGPLGPNGLQSSCIINPVTQAAYQYVVFTNQNRSNFLGKYGAGVRIAHVYPAKSKGSAPYDGMIDLAIAQDETITGGRFHGALFKIDAQYPFAYGPASFIYFFGSASVRIRGNQNLSPLILTVPMGSMTPTIPSANVTVLSLQQPDRDFYRIGIGLNLLDVFSKLKSGPSTGNADKAAGGDAGAGPQQ